MEDMSAASSQLTACDLPQATHKPQLTAHSFYKMDDHTATEEVQLRDFLKDAEDGCGDHLRGAQSDNMIAPGLPQQPG